MTTIAAMLDADNDCCAIACDPFCSSDDGTIALQPHEKLGSFRQGRREAVVGVSGRWVDCQWLLDQDVPVPGPGCVDKALRSWWRPKAEERIASLSEELLEEGMLDLTALWCSPEAIVILGGDGSVIRVRRGYHAIGSGGAAALGVLAYGARSGAADPIDVAELVELAVRIGTQLDVGAVLDADDVLARIVTHCPTPRKSRILRP